MNKLLKKLPFPFKKSIYKYVVGLFKEKWIEMDNAIPKYEVEQKHIKNLEVLPDRHSLLERLPKQGVVAEIGVDKGEFTELIMKKNSPYKLHLIDSWDSQRYHKGLQNVVEKKFQNQIEQGLIEVNVGLSTDVGESLTEEYFDWVYIDTDHSYQTTKAELELYSSKVKADGIIAGHDFIVGNWNGMVRYGVIEAVYEFCVKNDWEMIYLTMENKGHPSFAIRKIR